MALRNAFADLNIETTQGTIRDRVTEVAAGVRASGTAPVASQPGTVGLVVRRDADTTPVTDGQLTTPATDAEGRLKVAPSVFLQPLVSGVLDAVNAQVAVDTSRSGSVLFQLTAGPFAGLNITFEGSTNSSNGADGAWFAINAHRTTGGASESATGALSAVPTYGWRVGAVGARWVRARASAITSGSGTVFAARSATGDASPPGPPSTQSVSGAVTANAPAGTAGLTVTTAGTNATLVKASAASLYELTVSNPTGAAVFVKLYNKATAPVVGTDVPVVTCPVGAAGLQWHHFGVTGKRFALGLGWACTGAMPAADTTAASAGVQISATYT
jgi:hypothetical protein